MPQSVGHWEDTLQPDSSLPHGLQYLQRPRAVLKKPGVGGWGLGRTRHKPVLATAVSAHYEARRMDFDHPSAAFLGYVAAIEGAGSKLVDPAQCEHCGSHTGARRRFRKALRTVMTNKDIGAWNMLTICDQWRRTTGRHVPRCGPDRCVVP